MLKDSGYKISDDLYKMNEMLKNSNTSNENFSRAKYEKIVEEEKNRYANYVFSLTFENNGEYRFTDGFGNDFATKREALASFNDYIANKADSLKTSYVFEMPSGQRYYFNDKYDLDNFITDNQLLDEKVIRKSQLLNSTTFAKLEDINTKVYYSIYFINYYGETRYFRTEKQAWQFIYSHETIKREERELSIMQYDFKGTKFYSEVDLND